MKVLIVDDDHDLCSLLSYKLKKEAYSVNHVDRIAEAEKILKEDKPEVLILDNQLPDGLGISYIPILKKYQPDVLIILVTADPSFQNRHAALNRGADYFLNKPFQMDTVLDIIRSSTQNPGMNAAMAV